MDCFADSVFDLSFYFCLIFNDFFFSRSIVILFGVGVRFFFFIVVRTLTWDFTFLLDF